MWTPLSEGDVSLSLPAGVWGAVAALFFAIAVVLVVVFRRRGDDADDASDAAVEALSEALVKAKTQLKEKDALLAEAYQQGFVPSRQDERRQDG